MNRLYDRKITRSYDDDELSSNENNIDLIQQNRYLLMLLLIRYEIREKRKMI